MKALIAAAALTVLAAPAFAQDAGSSVAFTFQLGQPTGQVMVALYDSAEAYSGAGRPVRVAQVAVTGASAEIDFTGLPAGDYAAKVFHDLDGDGEMDANPFGMPTEPYAFSNNAVGNMGPAGWDRAHFAVAGDVAQTLDLNR